LYRVRDTVVRENPSHKVNGTRYLKDSAGRIIDSVLFDPSEAISIDLAKALANRNSRYDMVLREGDVIYVPAVNPIITVKGAVQTPLLKIYFDDEHTNLGYYIDKAGGFAERPWRKRIYVTYANGRSERTHNFGFFHFYPRVKQGSVVVIPEKPKGKNLGGILGQVFVTSIPIAIAFILTSL
ncbi:MAG: hypothetical protein ABIO76_02605, partial [Ginsengibacter sp.]